MRREVKELGGSSKLKLMGNGGGGGSEIPKEDG